VPNRRTPPLLANVSEPVNSYDVVADPCDSRVEVSNRDVRRQQVGNPTDFDQLEKTDTAKTRTPSPHNCA
jgi:hypothetical protein